MPQVYGRSGCAERLRLVQGGQQGRVAIVNVRFVGELAVLADVDRPIGEQHGDRRRQGHVLGLARGDPVVDRLAVPLLFVVEEQLHEIQWMFYADAPRTRVALGLGEEVLVWRVVQVYREGIRKTDHHLAERIARAGILAQRDAT